MQYPSLRPRNAAAIAAAALAVACSSTPERRHEDIAGRGGPMSETSFDQRAGLLDRKVVRSAELVLSVESPEQTSGEVERLIETAGGFVGHSRSSRNSSISLRCRVPAAHLDRLIEAIASLGEEERRALSADDVTERYADLETRLRNDVALRERLRHLLQRATDVQDVLAIEKELGRLQSEIETLQAAFDRLQSQVELSDLSIELRHKRILGPLGYAAYGLWWSLSKLFVIR